MQTLKFKPFSIQDVKLLDGPFKAAHEANIAYLFRLSPQRLLVTFWANAGIPVPAGIKAYAGWESPNCDLRGHTMGHYLTALSLLIASDQNQEAQQRLNYLVDELEKCQNQFPNGYLSAFPEKAFDIVETSGEGWAPHYTIHKLLQGMLDAYCYAGNQTALSCAVKMGDWLSNRCDKLERATWQTLFDKVETGGICESLANLFLIVGDPKYLQTAEFFVQDSKYYPALQGIDQLHKPITGNYHHSNTTIPQFIGLFRLYQATGNPDYLQAVTFFWQQVALHRSYATGGTGFHEHWNYGPDTLSQELDYQAQETCCSYNMLKLSKDLLCEDANSLYGDYYERVLYNHILASQHPENGRMIYMLSLRPGHWKLFGNEEDAFWCCQGSGIENHNRYGEAIYFKGEDEFLVNLFIASKVSWKEKKVEITQQTNFPASNISILKISGHPGSFVLKIRVPYWAKNGILVKVNGEKLETAVEGSFIAISRNWEDHDEVELELSLSTHLEFLADDASKFAILYGPIVMAAELGKSGMPSIYSNNNYYNPPPDSLLAHDAMPELDVAIGNTDWIVATKEPLHFIVTDKQQAFRLKPLYSIYDQKYHVYWQLKKDKRTEPK
ncbi:MAG: glycoside hydrolase family 127 protein [Caldilineaceae bacterium]